VTEDLQRLYDQLTCAQIEREEARRTIVVPGPATAVKVEAWLIAHGLDDLMTVVCSPYIKAGTMVVIDERAIEAGGHEALQHSIRESRERLKAPTCQACGANGYGGPPLHRLDCPVSYYAWGLRVMNPSSAFTITGT
jgi:hypothetical protein